MPTPRPGAATDFLRRLGALPIRHWLAVRDGMLERDHAPVFAAYRMASAIARDWGSLTRPAHSPTTCAA